MSLTADAILLLASKGLSVEEIAEVARVNAPEKGGAEAHSPRTKAAERMAKYRERRRDLGLPASFSGASFIGLLSDRDGPGCVYCTASDAAVVDHILPISQGGTDDIRNLCLSCHACNCGKAGRTPEQWGRNILKKTAAHAYQEYVREHRERVHQNSVRDVREHISEHVRAPRARVEDNLLTTEVTGLATAAVNARDPVDDWPEGKAIDWANALVVEAASPRLDPAKEGGLVLTLARLPAWKIAGASWEFDVVPVVRELTRKRGPPIKSWKFFDDAIARSVASNRQALEIPAHERPDPSQRSRPPFIRPNGADLDRLGAAQAIARRRGQSASGARRRDEGRPPSPEAVLVGGPAADGWGA